MENINPATKAIAWCLAWGNEREPKDQAFMEQIRVALGNKGEFPVEFQQIIQQVNEIEELRELEFPDTLPKLKELSEKYPQLWKEQIGLVYGGATKIKQYVFESAKIQEIRGASGLLDRINQFDLQAFFGIKKHPEWTTPDKTNLYDREYKYVRKWLNDNFGKDYNLTEALIPELIIYSSGGNILAFCPTAYVDNLANAIEKRYTLETLTANSCAVGHIIRPLEVWFGFLKDNIETTLWLEWYRQNFKNPLVEAYFGQPKNEEEIIKNFKTRKSFNEIATKLAVLFNQRRSGNNISGRPSRHYPPIFETHPYLIRDGSDRRSSILRVDEGDLPRETYFSEASVRKYLVGTRTKKGYMELPKWYLDTKLGWKPGAVERWTDRFNEFLNQHPDYKSKYYANLNPEEIEIAQTLTHVANASDGFIAYIYADGNNMGGYIQKKITTPQQYKDFSNDLEIATTNAVYQALAKNLQPHRLKQFNDLESDLKNDDLVHPFEIITIGGDDILIIVPADKALVIAKVIGEKFEEIMLERSTNYRLKLEELNSLENLEKVHRYKPETANYSKSQLSTSIGVLITSVNTPIYYARELLDQLVKSAKNRAKKLIKLGYYGGTVDFLTLKSVTMIASNIQEFRKEALTKHKLKLYATPYTLHELGGLLDLIMALRKAEFPKSQLYQIRSLLELDRHTAIDNYHYFRVRLNQGKEELISNFENAWCLPKDNNNKGNLAPWMFDNRKLDSQDTFYETIWRDMVDIYNFTKISQD